MTFKRRLGRFTCWKSAKQSPRRWSHITAQAASPRIRSRCAEAAGVSERGSTFSRDFNSFRTRENQNKRLRSDAMRKTSAARTDSSRGGGFAGHGRSGHGLKLCLRLRDRETERTQFQHLRVAYLLLPPHSQRSAHRRQFLRSRFRASE